MCDSDRCYVAVTFAPMSANSLSNYPFGPPTTQCNSDVTSRSGGGAVLQALILFCCAGEARRFFAPFA